ncbi:MAG: anaerobic ribonucleoside-triphosphate reductase activating protein [Saprospiraceae bacterium]
MNINKEHISNKSWNRKSIYSITPFTLLDYPDKTACILWFAGCNMRCGYCYNPEIVFGKGQKDFGEVYRFLDSRKYLLDAVVLSGGECMMHHNILELIIEIKELGYLVKIDTNGSKPKLLSELIKLKLVDYVALDFKATPFKFLKITKSDLFDEFSLSLDILIASGIPFEVRTTYHSDLLTLSDLSEMVEMLDHKRYQGKYFIQQFRNGVDTIGNLKESKILEKWTPNSKNNIEILFRNNDH